MLKKYSKDIISIIIAIAAIYAAYDIFIKGRSIKQLQITIDTVAPLMTEYPQGSEALLVFYNGKSISYPTLIQVTIKNTGNQPILGTDFIEPLTFSFAPQDEILRVSISTLIPSNIGMDITKTSNYQATTSSVLLNPNDIASLIFIVSFSDYPISESDWQVSGRIIGINEIKLTTLEEIERIEIKKALLKTIFGVITGMVSAVLGISIFYNQFNRLAEKTSYKIYEWLSRISKKYFP